MKRILATLGIAAISCSAMFSQTLFDGLKSSETDIIGTARYSSMAGAFGALGGDASAIKDNPAALGIYRKSELSVTANMLMQTSNSSWLGASSSSDLYKIGADNFSLILASPTWRSESGASGLQSSNFSFTYNKLRNFNRSLEIKGGNSSSSLTDYMAYFSNGLTGYNLAYVEGEYEPFDQSSIPWLSILAFDGYMIYETGSNTKQWEPLLASDEKVVPSYTSEETGGIHQYSFGWSGNFSNKFFLGFTANLQTINYSQTSYYKEAFSNNGGLSLRNNLTMTGSGVNFSMGAIAAPTDFVRFGFSFQTPTFYSIKTSNYGTLDYDTEKLGYVQSPVYTLNTQTQTPFQFNVSGAFIVDKQGLISAEYIFKNYKGMRLLDEDGISQTYNLENGDIKAMLNNSRTIKIGGEYRLTDNFSLRAGYANVSSIAKEDATKWVRDNTKRTDTEYFLHNRTDYYTAGFGYREASWYIDFAYMRKSNDESFYAYNSTNMDENRATTPAKVLTKNNNIVVTLGLRF